MVPLIVVRVPCTALLAAEGSSPPAGHKNGSGQGKQGLKLEEGVGGENDGEGR